MGTNKENKLARFQKFQVLMAAGLNKALKNVGSVAGLLPYNEDLEVDKLMQFDIGAKDSPFGNIYGKALNPFTTSEVLQFVADGLLTENDRMLFINQDTNQLAFWNGQQIVSISGGGGGGASMDYLLGDGSDGDMTFVSNATIDRPLSCDSLTIVNGVTLTPARRLQPIIIRCKGKVTIQGTLSANGMGFARTEEGFANSVPSIAFVNITSAANVPTGAGANKTDFTPLQVVELRPYSFGGKGARSSYSMGTTIRLNGGGQGGIGVSGGGGGNCSLVLNNENSNAPAGGGGAAVFTNFFKELMSLSYTKIPLFGGSGGQGQANNAENYGGGCIIIFAKEVEISTGGVLSANGLHAGNQAGGGGGGLIAIYASSLLKNGTASCNGGGANGGLADAFNRQASNGGDVGRGGVGAGGGGGVLAFIQI